MAVTDDHLQQNRTERAAYWRGVGQLETVPTIRPARGGDPTWPGGSPTFLTVVTPYAGVYASDGLSDAAGVEVYVEGRELVPGSSEGGDWLRDLLEELASSLAGAGDVRAEIVEHGLLSVDLEVPSAPEDWRSDGHVSALLGIHLPGRELAAAVGGGFVPVLTVSPLRPSERAVIEAEGGAGRRRVADALAASGWHSYAETARPAVL